MNRWPLVIVGCVVLLSGLYTVGCSRWSNAGINADIIAQTQPTPGITFEGDVPTWADDATAIMAELEQWRGRSFIEPLN
jgi:hypothetical protein